MNLRELFPVFRSCKSLCKEATIFQHLGPVVFWSFVGGRMLPGCGEYPRMPTRHVPCQISNRESWVGSRGAVFCGGLFLQQELYEWKLALYILNSTMAARGVCISGIVASSSYFECLYWIWKLFNMCFFQSVSWAPHIYYMPWRLLKLSLGPSIIPCITIT